jgi:hypothetical protein
MPQIGVDHPVDQLADFPLDLPRRVGDDLSFSWARPDAFRVVAT